MLLMAAAVFMTNYCYFEESKFLVVGIASGWFLAFVFLGKRTRFVLFFVALWALYFYPHTEFVPSAEAAAISTLRREAIALQEYCRNHPLEGYPPAPPAFQPKCRARKVYEFQYSREKSGSAPTADRFILVAVPTGESGLRSFALTEDDRLHATEPNLHRPANRMDKTLE